jgi:membrane protease YdiL (CAAX protease family)
MSCHVCEHLSIRPLVISRRLPPLLTSAYAATVRSTVAVLVTLNTEFSALEGQWLNLYYLTLGLTFGLITWPTGGLETSSVIHAANNTLAYPLMIVTHADALAGSDRSAGTGSIVMLVPCVLLGAVTVWARTRRIGPALTPGLCPLAGNRYPHVLG